VVSCLEASNNTPAREALAQSLFNECRYLKRETMVPLVLNRISVTQPFVIYTFGIIQPRQ